MPISVPHPDFIPSTTISSSQVETNFATLAAAAVNGVTGDTITGPMSMQDINPRVTGTYPLGTSDLRWLNLQLSDGVFAYGRTTADGVWQTQAFSSGDYTGNGSMTWTVESGDVHTNRYTLIGKTLFWDLVLNNTTIGGTANTMLMVRIPAGATAASASHTVRLSRCANNGSSVEAYCQVFDGTRLGIWRQDGANWTLSTNNNGFWLSTAISIF